MKGYIIMSNSWIGVDLDGSLAYDEEYEKGEK